MTRPDLSAIRAQLAGIGCADVLTWDGPGQARRALYTQDGTPILQCSVLMYPEPQWAAFIAVAPSMVAGLLAVVERVEALAAGWEEEAGRDSTAERVFGRQVVSVEFAVESIRAAITGGGE